MSERQQPWSGEQAEQAADDGGPGLEPRAGDAAVLCEHDAPDAPAALRAALASEAS